VPLLATGHQGGSYDTADQTIVTGKDSFTLHALGGGTPSGNYYVSAALDTAGDSVHTSSELWIIHFGYR